MHAAQLLFGRFNILRSIPESVVRIVSILGRRAIAGRMSELLFPLSAPTLPIVGSAQMFPVGRIFCVGRNYAAHAREMGADPTREAPFFFMKPANAATLERALPYPAGTESLHHEVELVVAIGAKGAIAGYGVGVDLTKRDVQDVAKKAGRPWEESKAFPRSAPVSALRLAKDVSNADDARIVLSVNGDVRQESRTSHLIWSVPEVIARLEAMFELTAGDLIFTGTPEGVGALTRGDAVSAEIEGVGELTFSLS